MLHYIDRGIIRIFGLNGQLLRATAENKEKRGMMIVNRGGNLKSYHCSNKINLQ